MFDDVPLLLAFTGGLVAIVNPCGFAMLPAYLSFFLGLDGDAAPVDRATAVARALRVGVIVSVGFAVVFGAAGLLLSAGARALTTVIPWAALVVGAAVAALGVWLLTGRTLRVALPAPARAGQGRSGGAVFVFGLAYAVASLSCTLPVFLAVVAGTATSRGVTSAMAVFGVYVVGMALPLLTLTIGLALGRDALVRRARVVGRHTNRIAGGLLVVAGVYIVAFWVIELAGVTGGPVPATVLLVERASAALTNLIGGRPVLLGAALFAVVIVSAVAAIQSTSGDPSPPGSPASSPTKRSSLPTASVSTGSPSPRSRRVRDS
ncbi:cytochrome c biogenesis CcdA family protein [soil metagenome]